jgi:dihydroneopterin aldolase / 2-amino-4-hydroxy-6-hydroxymethyldihydropteridine diphosphokinase
VQIRIEGLEVYAYHGVLAEEKTLGQPFVLDLILCMDECRGCRSDRVEDTIDYTEVIDAVTEVATGESYDLLEKVAGEVGRRILEQFPAVDEVDVKVRKPRPPIPCSLQSVGVRLSVSRTQVSPDSSPTSRGSGVAGAAGAGAEAGAGASAGGLSTSVRVFLGLGSNLGDAEAHLKGAVAALDRLPGTRVESVSSLYRTAPMGPVMEQPDFYNLVVALRTAYPAPQLLAACQGLEAAFGRVREKAGGPRTLDVDLLWYEGEESVTSELELPHPRMEQRRFVLEPLAEIAPGLVLPSGRSVEEALAVVGSQKAERLPRTRQG